MNWKMLAGLALVLAVIGTACGRPAATVPPPGPVAQTAAGFVTVSAGDQGLLVVDTADGQVARTLPAGTPSPDWRVLYRLRPGALDVLDPLTGAIAASHPAPGWAGAVRTSAGGHWLVLAGAGPGDRFQVLDAGFTAPPVDIALDGTFTFDGISEDGQRLYLLEWAGVEHYQVRMYDVGLGRLSPNVISDKTEIGQPMTGVALAGFTTRDGSMQLTLYQRSATGQAFVHALPVGHEFPVAFCVDLPGPADGWSFAAAPSGQTFWAVNAGAGIVARLTALPDQPPDLRVSRIGALPEAAGAGGAALAVAPDSATLYVGTSSRVVAVDARTGTVRLRGPAGQPVSALAVAPDGGSVYAVSGATSLVRLDPRTLAPTGSRVTLRASLGAIVHTT
jgi:PQQ-like domain